MSRGEVRVLDGGFLTTIQDARGRPGLGRFGIPPGGAMVPEAARLANRLVGNDGDAPVLEVTAAGLTLAWGTVAHIGLAGDDLGAFDGRLPLSPGQSHRLAAGSRLRFTGGDGIRAYLAVAGGFAIPAVLGSASTDRRTGFGGLSGRALRAGDTLRIGDGALGPLRSVAATRPVADAAATPIRVVATPDELDWFAPSALDILATIDWVVRPSSDRNGLRLGGGRVEAAASGIPSLGVPVGSIQVPPSGEPIITMVDGPVTGGYPVIAVVARRELDRLGRLRPGAAVRFQVVSVDDARAIAVDAPRIDVDAGDDAAGWAG